MTAVAICYLKETEKQSVELPRDARILSIAPSADAIGDIHVWYSAKIDEPRTEIRRFEIYCTGDTIRTPSQHLTYIGTCRSPHGWQVHVFEHSTPSIMADRT